MAEPRVLIYDLETAHNLTAAFQLYGNDYIPHQNIIRERFIICACWRWLGEKKTHAVSILDDPDRFSKDPYDDKHVVKVLHNLISEADVVVAHNGDKFDNKYLQTRALFHKLSPTPPFTSIDTYKIAKQRFNFNSNRLDYIGKFLGLGGKKKTEEGLWLDVLKGNKRAIRKMVDYNKRDVELLEKIFIRLQPFMPNHVNRELFGGIGCPRCGSKRFQSRGTHKAITRVYQRFQCQNPKCMGWFRALKANKESSKFRVL